MELGPRVSSAQLSWVPQGKERWRLFEGNGGQGSGFFMASCAACDFYQLSATGNVTVMVGVWLGSLSHHLSHFFACHFQVAWESYLSSDVCADNIEMENPDAIFLLEEWLDSLSDDGGETQEASTTPSVHVWDPDVLSAIARWGGDDDISMSSNECNKTLDSVDQSVSCSWK
jgi:hypothetical protein